jgi:hypothetical protein
VFEFWSVTPYLLKKSTRHVSAAACHCALVGCNEVADAVGAEYGARDVPAVEWSGAGTAVETGGKLEERE